MTAIQANPRAAGYNYGVGWGKSPKPPIYLEGMRIARRLGEMQMAISRASWGMEMACRSVRLAETGAEKAKAVAGLEREIAKHRYAIAAADGGIEAQGQRPLIAAE